MERGASVVITGRNKDRLSEAESNLLKISSLVVAHNIDVSDESQVTKSLKDTYERVTKYFDDEIKDKLSSKNVLISAHGNSIRALCKNLLSLDNDQISNLEIPTGNPLIIEFDNSLKIQKYYYLDENRAKTIIFNQ